MTSMDKFLKKNSLSNPCGFIWEISRGIPGWLFTTISVKKLQMYPWRIFWEKKINSRKNFWWNSWKKKIRGNRWRSHWNIYWKIIQDFQIYFLKNLWRSFLINVWRDLWKITGRVFERLLEETFAHEEVSEE